MRSQIWGWIILLLPHLYASTEDDVEDWIDDVINWDNVPLDDSKKLEPTPSTQLGTQTNQLAQNRSLHKYTTLQRRPPLDGHEVLNDRTSKRTRVGPSTDELRTNTNSPIFSSLIPPDQLRPHTSLSINPVRSSLNTPHLTRVESGNSFHHNALGHQVLNDRTSKRTRVGPSTDELRTNTNSPIFSSSIPPDQLRPHTSLTINPVRSSLNTPHLTRVESGNSFHHNALLPTLLATQPCNDLFSSMIRVQPTHDTLETSPPHSSPFIISSSLPESQLQTLESSTQHNPSSLHNNNHITQLKSGNPIIRTSASPPDFLSKDLFTAKEIKMTYPISPSPLSNVDCIFPRSLPDSPFKFSYSLILCEPSSIDQEIIIEAISTLEIQNRIKFINVDGLPQKLFCLPASADRQRKFFFQFFDFANSRRAASIEGKNRTKAFEKIWKDVSTLTDKPQYAIGRFREYVSVVCKPFGAEINRVGDRIYAKFHLSPMLEHYQEYFERIIHLFGFHLLYVDLISAILPAKNTVSPVEGLKTARSEAGLLFLETIERSICDPEEMGQSATPSLRTVWETVSNENRRKALSNYGAVWALNWKLLENWIYNQRSELAPVIAVVHSELQFKKFFNSLVFFWFQNVAEKNCSAEL